MAGVGIPRLPASSQGSVAGARDDKGTKTDFEITPEQVKALAENGSRFTLLDVREPWEVQTASIAGSTLIPMSDVPARAHRELDPEEHIVVVCHHGIRSANVCAWLRQQGFEKVQSMRGGIDQWSRTIDPKVPLY